MLACERCGTACPEGAERCPSCGRPPGRAAGGSGLPNDTLHVLVGEAGPLTGKQYPITASGLRVGRDPKQNQLVVEDEGVSRLHARFYLDPEGRIYLEDSSVNGTFVNGRRIQGSVILKPGSIVQFSSNPAHRFRYQRQAGARPAGGAAAVRPTPASSEELQAEHLRMEAELERRHRLLAIMFVDIAGSTAYYERHGDTAGVLLVEQVESTLLPIMAQHGGALVKSIGDAIMCRFDSAEGAVLSAIAMQGAIAARNLGRPDREAIRIRAAINYGVGIVRGNDVFGDFVNVAARIESVSEPEEIVVSPSVCEQVRGHAGILIERKAADVSLKGRTAKLDLYRVLWRQDASARAIPAAPSQKQIRLATGVYKTSSGPPPAAKPLRFSLVREQAGGRALATYSLDGPVVTAGSGPADIVLPDDPLLPPIGARFRVGKELFIEPAEDQKAVFLRLTEPHKLAPGDVILAGRNRFCFQAQEAASDALSDETAGAPAPPKVARLLHLAGGDTPDREYLLAEHETVLGRVEGTYTFPDDFLSSRHCRISRLGSDFVFEDLGSRNGSFLRIRGRQSLRAGDIVLIGRHLLRVVAQSR